MRKTLQKVADYVQFKLNSPWERKGDIVAFGDPESGAYVGAAKSRPEFSATTYRDMVDIREALTNYPDINRGLELGCGYGRVSPYIQEHLDELIALDLNSDAITIAQKHYPEVGFLTSSATTLPFNDSSFDLIVSWTTLMHIPPSMISDAVAEVNRVLDEDGLILCCETTQGEPSETNWPRPVQEYQKQFSNYKLAYQRKRDKIPTTDNPTEEIFVLKREG